MLINATVSHELRNPLNSLIAQNIEKEALYEELKEEIEIGDKNKLRGILKKLKKGLHI
jgi:signal transduction histidine kinase